MQEMPEQVVSVVPQGVAYLTLTIQFYFYTQRGFNHPQGHKRRIHYCRILLRITR
jgi:hypothetical protein